MPSTDRPPDKYKCIKMPLKNIIKDKSILPAITDCVRRTHRIAFKTTHLLCAWVLKTGKTYSSEIIDACQQSVIKYITGPKPGLEKAKLMEEFFEIQKLIPNFTQENGEYLSQVLTYQITEIITNIENNLKAHFFDYINIFVNAYYSDELEKLSSSEKKNLKKELTKVKNDFKRNELKSDAKYHKFITEYRHKLLPTEYKENYAFDLKENPEKYLLHALYINRYAESKNRKMFQLLPLVKDTIMRNIPIDTKTLFELFCNKEEYHKNLTAYQKSVWNRFFHNIPDKYNDNYVFDNCVLTDGYSCSIRYIEKGELERSILKKYKMGQGRQNKKLERENQAFEIEQMFLEDKYYVPPIVKETKVKNENKKLTKKQLEKQKENNELQYMLQEDKYDYLKTPIILQKSELPIVNLNAPKAEKKSNDYVDFLYFDEVPDLPKVIDGKRVIYGDPGKRGLFTFLGEIENEDIFFTYSNASWLRGNKRLKYQRKNHNERRKMKILEKENELSNFNSKTCDFKKFIEYFAKKIEINNALYKKYENTVFRQYRWFAYIAKKRSQDNMLNMIEKKYGKDIVIILGDASIGVSMRHFISTPNIMLKRILKRRFQVYLIDEFRTSCLHHKTEQYTEHLSYIDKKGKSRELHAVLTAKLENTKRLACVNRDRNACKNMRKIFLHYLRFLKAQEPLSRPYRFQRGIELDEEKTKETNQLSNSLTPIAPSGHLCLSNGK